MIYVVIPVHNRVRYIETLLTQLTGQTARDNLTIVVVDAGSVDDTVAHVIAESQRFENIKLIRGSSDWFWGRSTQEGIDSVLSDLSYDDYLLLLNDDVEIEDSYIQKSLDVLAVHPNSVLGSILVDQDTREIFHMGVKCNPQKLAIEDLEISKAGVQVFNADLVSGRGTFYPASLFMMGLRLNWKKIPHYLADYDLSRQAVGMGAEIIGCSDVKVFTKQHFGNQIKFPNRFQALTSVKSPSRLISQWSFWSHYDGKYNPFLLAARILRFRILGSLIR